MMTDRALRRATERLCANSEYFDGGGLKPTGEHREYGGDCLNSLSPRFETRADQICDKWVKDSSLDDEGTAPSLVSERG